MMRHISLVYCIHGILALRGIIPQDPIDFNSIFGLRDTGDLGKEYALRGSQLTKFRTNENQEKAHVLLLFTCSGENRNYDSLCMQAKLNNRSGMPKILHDADVMVYDNGGGISDDATGLQMHMIPKAETRKAHARACMSMFAGAKELLYMSNENVGYRMGAVQAMNTLMVSGLLKDYDWVVHLHPDIFLANPLILEHALLHTSKAVLDGRFKKVCYTFNFFAFKPQFIASNAFSEYNTFRKNGSPECYLAEHAFPKHIVEFVPHVSLKQFGPNSITKFGTWHQHNLVHVQNFLKSNPEIKPPKEKQNSSFKKSFNLSFAVEHNPEKFETKNTQDENRKRDSSPRNFKKPETDTGKGTELEEEWQEIENEFKDGVPW